MGTRTRRILVATGLGMLPGILLVLASIGIEVWVEAGGGLGFGIMGIALVVVGAAVGAGLGAARPDTRSNPLLGAMIGAVPGLVLSMGLGARLSLPVIIVGGAIGYVVVRRHVAKTAPEPRENDPSVGVGR